MMRLGTLVRAAAALVLLGAAEARADYTVTAGLGQHVGPTWLMVKACHKSGELTLARSEGSDKAYALRIREGDRLWDEVARELMMSVNGTISVVKIENCVGTFVIYYQKSK